MRAILGKLNRQLLENLAIEAGMYCTHVEAAVAYADGPNHPFLRACRQQEKHLTYYGLLEAEGGASVSFLREILSWGPSYGEARLVKGHFHAKAIWWHGFGAYIGSANFTDKAWQNNIEAGVFVSEDELKTQGVAHELASMFSHLGAHSIPVTDETLRKLEKVEGQRRFFGSPTSTNAASMFNSLFGAVPDNPPLALQLPKPSGDNRAKRAFTLEWTETLQTMRGLAKEFSRLDLRPSWVSVDAQSAIHFDQFLHAYYYHFVCKSMGAEAESGGRSIAKVAACHASNKGNLGAALRQAATWWAELQIAPDSEDEFIASTAPAMANMLSARAISTMELEDFVQAMTHVNAFRTHARQVPNATLGLPQGHKESADQRIQRLCEWLWNQRTSVGRRVVDILEYVIWGKHPMEMESRLWNALNEDEYRIDHFGQSILGEAVGWARPDEFPPRNNRTNKALRALGHNVRLFSGE